MAKMILGIFGHRDEAESAINRFNSAGYNADDISIIMKDEGMAHDMSNTTGANVAGSATKGAATGGVIGGLAGLLMGIGAITIPGLGAILIGGPIAAALGLTGAAATTVSGALTGALAGGLVGVLVGLGVPEEDAREYEERIQSGSILVAVPVKAGLEEEARDIMELTGADQIRSIGITERGRREMVEDEYQAPAVYSRVGKNKKAREEDEDIDDDDLM